MEKSQYEEWFKSFDMRKELYLDVWVLIPNHFHALITLNPVDTDGRAYPPNNDENFVDNNNPNRNNDNENSVDNLGLDTHVRAYLRKIIIFATK